MSIWNTLRTLAKPMFARTLYMLSGQTISTGMGHDIVIELGIPQDQVSAATALYCAAFGEKLTPFLGDVERAARFLAAGVAPDRAIVALLEGQVVGIAGFKVNGRGLYEPGIRRFFGEYGWSAPLRIFGLLLLERAEHPDTLLMDGIAVDPELRGRGVGTQLLAAVERQARALGKSDIRLDVIDTNPGAKRLYERFGFKVRKTRDIGPLRLLFAFTKSIEMRLDLSTPAQT